MSAPPASTAAAAAVLRFAPLQSCVDVTFWSELGDRKLDEYKLSETPVDLRGFLTASRHEEVGSMLQVQGTSFAAGDSTTATTPQGMHAVPGRLLLVNTMEALRRLDKGAALQQVGAEVWADIVSGAAEAQPDRLARFLLLAHGDLKHFVFTYWFAFPALKPPQPFTLLSPATHLGQAYPELQHQIAAAADAWRAAAADAGGEQQQQHASTAAASFCLLTLDSAAGAVQTAGLSSWEQLHASAATDTSQQQQQPSSEVLLLMFDPCQLALTPGWPLRNALLLAAVRWRAARIRVVCIRDSSAGRASAQRSFVLDVQLPAVPDGWPAPAAAAPEALGWEANAAGKLLPRTVDVSHLLSPTQLAEQAVDLNLRLMRWRAAPELDVQRLAATKCLLLGAGTLGCAVARCLLAWGVRRITFVDSATVSYSNPVRQSLFVFEDCLGGGKPKAAAAAAALGAIFPSVQAQAVELSIPMPGHPPANEQQEAAAQQAAERLHQLVAEHDVVYLLTDTRESRWLPTLLAAAAGKVAVTAALGFDGFVVMRHGLPQQQQLGCYFCNDVVAPLNSTVDRALDQQCTVARPGLAPIAGSLAVELMAALLQHPLRGHAPAPGSSSASSAAAGGSGALGPVPHMIRGQLSGFGQTCMEGQAFSQCTACSPAVLQRYAAEGWGFVRRVLAEPGLLEELTGLAELHRQAAALDLGGSSSDEGEQQRTPGAGGEDADEDWTEL